MSAGPIIKITNTADNTEISEFISSLEVYRGKIHTSLGTFVLNPNTNKWQHRAKPKVYLAEVIL